MIKNDISIINEILNYESKFNGFLIRLYTKNMSVSEFRTDLINIMNTDGVGKFLTYYRNCLKNYSANSSEEQIKSLKDMILILEGVVY